MKRLSSTHLSLITAALGAALAITPVSFAAAARSSTPSSSSSAPSAGSSGDLTDEMDALGGSKDLIRKARAIDPENRVRVVQNRDVDRDLRFELNLSAGLVSGGDPYTNSNILGGELNFHLTPHWSLGARYTNYSNTLSAEGQRVLNNAAAANSANPGSGYLPGHDYAKNSYLGVIDWYPIYGKINFLDLGITQFDIYFLAGAGQINLQSGSQPLYTAGGGLAFWWNKHFSTRLEVRWEGYTDHPTDGVSTYSRSINDTILGLSLGFLF